MKRIVLFLSVLLTAACTTGELTLKKAFAGKFILGAAVNQRQIQGTDIPGDSVLFRHFGAIEPENCLKSAEIMPAFGQYNWELADQYVDFGEKNGLDVFGHCLIWHSQCTPDFCYDQDGQLISPELLKERMKQHITTVMTRYKGRIKGWDVVNEAILEDGSWRQSPFWQILGEDYIPWAFRCAQDADPDCELYYNDYSMHEPKKLDTVIELVKKMQAQGIRIDAIGFQGHVGMDYPDLDLYESHIRRVKDETGLDVCITELDMSILPSVTQSADVSGINWFEAMRNPETRESLLAKLDPYKDGIPEDVYAAWNARMGAFLEMFIRNSDVVRRINVWGVTDADSWKNNWPIPGRHDAPLWIDRNFALKPFLKTYVHE